MGRLRVTLTPPSPTAAARALVRTASAYVAQSSVHYWGTPRWEAVLEARRAVGRAIFRGVGATVVSRGKRAAHTLARRWHALEGYADGAGPRAAVREGHDAFFALRAAAGLDLKHRRTYPLDAWYSAWCAREGRTYTAPAGLSAALDAQQLAEVRAERAEQLSATRTPRALARAWDVVLDDAWPEADLAFLEAARAARATVLADRLRNRIEGAKSPRALKSAWVAVKKAGRVAELEENLRASVARLKLTDAQASQLAA